MTNLLVSVFFLVAALVVMAGESGGWLYDRWRQNREILRELAALRC